MKFVIYGAGHRGKRLIKFLGKDNVVAFVDQDIQKIGNTYQEKPIISVDEYKLKFTNCLMIITPVYDNEIEPFLDENKVFQYNNLTELPSEFSGFGSCSFIEICNELTKKLHDHVYLYGINAYSIMLYEVLKKSFDVYLVKSDKDKLSKWIEFNCSEIKIKDVSDITDKAQVLLTVRIGQEEKEKLFYKNETIDAFYFSSNMSCYYNSNIEKFRAKFRERKRCFIVANGPSLKLEDFKLLKNEFCFGMNKIFTVETLWKPNVYVCSDSFLINEMAEQIANYDCEYKFIGDSGEKYWEKPRQNSYKVHVVGADLYEALPPFSENVAQKVYGHWTVTYACIQIACFMGFTEIYLVGVDCNYLKGSVGNHFYKSNEVDNMNHNESGMIMGYKSAKNYADEHGIKIFNATRGGMLEVFERIDFDSLFN